jgi:hypothetical protein
MGLPTAGVHTRADATAKSHWTKYRKKNLYSKLSSATGFWDPEHHYYLDETASIYCPCVVPKQPMPVDPAALTHSHTVALLASGLFTTQFYPLSGGGNNKIWQTAARPVTGFLYCGRAYFPSMVHLAAAQTLILSAHQLLLLERTGRPTVAPSFALWRMLTTVFHRKQSFPVAQQPSVLGNGVKLANDTHISLSNYGPALRNVIFSRVMDARGATMCKIREDAQLRDVLVHFFKPQCLDLHTLDHSALTYEL